MKKRLTCETKATIRTAFESATGTFAERSTHAFAKAGIALPPYKRYPSCWPWLGAPKHFTHAKTEGKAPPQPKPPKSKPTAAIQVQPLNITEAVEILADSIAAAVLPRIEGRIALALAASKPATVEKPAVSPLSTREKLLIDLRDAKARGDRFSVIRCVDKLRALENKEAKLDRELQDDQ